MGVIASGSSGSGFFRHSFPVPKTGWFRHRATGFSWLVLVSMLLLQSCAAPKFPTSDLSETAASSRISTSASSSNTGETPQSVANAAEWAALFVRIGLQQFSATDHLPNDHVVGVPEGVRQFEAGQNARLALTWFGHSSFLIRTRNASILTDPVFSQSVGPVPFRIRRIVPVLPDPGLIQKLDAIVISHGDYDHLDISTLRRLSRRFPDAILFVPTNASRLVRHAGFHNVRELGWYEGSSISGGTITAVPAIHAFRRPPRLGNSVHWNGYRINLSGGNLYFAGDTAFDSNMDEIMERTGPAEFALVPAGAYAPRKLQRPLHVNPEEAVSLARMTGARLAIAMHWGTFHLSEELPTEQRRRFLAASNGTTRTAVMKIGETRILRR